MKQLIATLLFLCFVFPVRSQEPDVFWTHAVDLGLWGQGWDELKDPYDRLPANAENIVRNAVWTLGTNTAGLSVHFRTNSPSIRAKWTVRYQNSMWHMTDCGIRGVDLYAEYQGSWRFAGSGNPGNEKSAERLLISHLDGSDRGFILHLPLYDGVDTLMIGVEEGSYLEPVSPGTFGKPVVIYGTSIQQGGCASRPGMAASNILSRNLNREVINLGFSGNGRMEPELAQLIGEVGASAYVIDCLPNLTDVTQIMQRTPPFVEYLRDNHPETPIFLVESPTPETAGFNPERLKLKQDQNKALQQIFLLLTETGMSNIYLIPADGLLGTDGEGTVDGVHYTDLGFQRYAKVLQEWIEKYAGKPAKPARMQTGFR